MKQFSTVDLVRDLKEVTHAATRAPVAITQHRKTRFVLMAIEDYEKMAGRGDTRRAYRIEETPPELAALMIPALEKLLADDEDGK